MTKKVKTIKHLEITQDPDTVLVVKSEYDINADIKSIPHYKDKDGVYHVFTEEQIDAVFRQNKLMREVLEHYGYPDHEDGDRAYVFGHKARKALKEIDDKS